MAVFNSNVFGRVLWLLLSAIISASLCLYAPGIFAQQNSQGKQRWVSDQFEITLRTGKDAKKKILRVLPSGAAVELLDADPSSNYSRVRTTGGTEGWVLDRYLSTSPPAKVRLPDVEARLKKSEDQRRQLERETSNLRREHAQLQRQTSQLEQSGTGLRKELDKIRRLSSSVIEVDEQNKELQQRLIKNEQVLDEVKAENSRLAARSNREWFVIGALVVIAGIMIGLILPRIRWRKKSGWGEL